MASFLIRRGGDAELVIAADVARLLGVSRQRAHQLSGQPGFARPIGRLGRSLVWRRRDVDAWAMRTGRAISDSCGCGVPDRFVKGDADAS
jgi:predicted DNA-binding transcriptional regulator AlpA